jgi:DNA-binding protein Fis
MTDLSNRALAMLDAFASVGVATFDITLLDAREAKVRNGSGPRVPLDELRTTVGQRVEEANQARQNFLIRPRRPVPVWVTTGPRLVQIDGLDEEAVQRVTPHAFLVVAPAPGVYEAWVNVSDVSAYFGRRLQRAAGADTSAHGVTRIAGSRNFSAGCAPDYPLVEIVRIQAGLAVTPDELDASGLVAPLPAVSADVGRKWPSYSFCVQHAPPESGGMRPDIGSADFAWCQTALDWGWSIEETAARLMETSHHAQQSGEEYARLTAHGAATAALRRFQAAKPKFVAVRRAPEEPSSGGDADGILTMPVTEMGNARLPRSPGAYGGIRTLKEVEDAHITRILRETQNVSQAAKILEIDRTTIYKKRRKGITPSDGIPDTPGAWRTLEDVRHAHIASVLRETEHNIYRAARILGIDRSTLLDKMRKYGWR